MQVVKTIWHLLQTIYSAMHPHVLRINHCVHEADACHFRSNLELHKEIHH